MHSGRPRTFTVVADTAIVRERYVGQQLDVAAGEVTGDEPAAKNPVTGLWPSDRAGVALTITGARA